MFFYSDNKDNQRIVINDVQFIFADDVEKESGNWQIKFITTSGSKIFWDFPSSDERDGILEVLKKKQNR